MRNWIELFETESFQVEREDFRDHMINAVTNAHMGFYFEEGGCWGMALALFDHYVNIGEAPVCAYTVKYSHAFIAVNGGFVDHQGHMPQPKNYLLCSPNELIDHAVDNCGMTIEEIQADRETAAEIIEAAVEMAS